MPRSRKYKSAAFGAIHEAASDLRKVGAISKTTMREFDEISIVEPEPLTPRDVQRLRQNAHVSQPVLARYLNTSPSTVKQWETGAKRPSGMALRLLHVVKKHGLATLT